MKRSFTGLIAATSLFVFTSAPVMAASGRSGGGLFFEENFIPAFVSKSDTATYEASPGAATESGLGIDSRTTIGYTLGGKFLLGFTYNMYNLTTKRAAVSGGSEGLEETTKRTEMGPSIGYVSNGWKVIGTIILSGSKEVHSKNVDTSGATTGDLTFKNTRPSGFQFAVGYTYAVGSNFEIGPTLIYKNLSYSHQSKTNLLNSSENYGETKLFSKHVDDSLTPMLSMQLRF